MNLRDILDNSIEGLTDVAVQYGRALALIATKPLRGVRIVASLHERLNLLSPAITASLSVLLLTLFFFAPRDGQISAFFGSFLRSDSDSFVFFVFLTIYLLLIARMASSFCRRPRKRRVLRNTLLLASSSLLLGVALLSLLSAPFIRLWPEKIGVIAALAGVVLVGLFGALAYQLDRAFLRRRSKTWAESVAVHSAFVVVLCTATTFSVAGVVVPISQLQTARSASLEAAASQIVKLVDCQVDGNVLRYVIHIFNDARTPVLLMAVSVSVIPPYSQAKVTFRVPISQSHQTAAPGYDLLFLKPNDGLSFAGEHALAPNTIDADEAKLVKCSGSLGRGFFGLGAEYSIPGERTLGGFPR